MRRLALAPGLTGVGCGLAAVALGGWGWLLAWPALAFGLAAAGYLGLGPEVLGKGSDGRRRPLIGLVAGPYLGWRRLQWWRRRFQRVPIWNAVGRGLYLGRRPERGRELPPDLRYWVDVTAELAPPRRLPDGVVYRCLPTLDYGLPREQAFRALLDELAPAEGGVLVHCAAGHGRSAMVAAALLVRRGVAADVDAAYARLQAARPGVRRNPRQVALARRVAGEVSRAEAAP